jgi:diguanylate cyclase (GGDEF)-like protein
MRRGSILVVSPNFAITDFLKKALIKSGKITVISHLHSAFDFIYNDIPDLLIIDLQGDSEGINLLNSLKEDPLFANLSVLVILGEDDQTPDWETLLVEDYIWLKDLASDACMKVDLCFSRSDRMVEVNPLTRLPGNISINRQIQSRLDNNIPFSIAYADLDHFKPFNDKYGFSRGDEVIKITGRLMLNIVRNKSHRSSFIGHVGGDDFICIMAPLLIEETCQEVIDVFDRIVPSFYDPQDRESGFIKSCNREGHYKQYPIMGISIGIVHIEKGTYSHYGEVTSVASEMKHIAKKNIASCYTVNRRIPTKIIETLIDDGEKG